MRDHADQPLEFERDTIRLDLPMQRTKVNDEWDIVPLMNPMVSS